MLHTHWTCILFSNRALQTRHHTLFPLFIYTFLEYFKVYVYLLTISVAYLQEMIGWPTFQNTHLGPFRNAHHTDLRVHFLVCVLLCVVNCMYVCVQLYVGVCSLCNCMLVCVQLNVGVCSLCNCMYVCGQLYVGVCSIVAM